MPKPTAPKPPTSRRPAPNEKRVAKRLTSGSTHSCRCCRCQLLLPLPLPAAVAALVAY